MYPPFLLSYSEDTMLPAIFALVIFAVFAWFIVTYLLPALPEFLRIICVIFLVVIGLYLLLSLAGIRL